MVECTYQVGYDFLEGILKAWATSDYSLQTLR